MVRSDHPPGMRIRRRPCRPAERGSERSTDTRGQANDIGRISRVTSPSTLKQAAAGGGSYTGGRPSTARRRRK